MRKAQMPCADVAGLVLAGGLARRMAGQHKAFLELAGKPLVEHVVQRLRPQVKLLLISANEQVERLQTYADAVLPDAVPGHAGPLAGILMGLEWLRDHHPEYRWLLSVAVDTPFFPADLCTRLRGAVGIAEMAVAGSRGRRHPVFALWPVSMAKGLRHYLEREGLRKVDLFTTRYRPALVQFDSDGNLDPFFNINTPDDLAQAQRLAQSRLH